MIRRIRWTTRAANQLQDAATYLEQERKGTGLPFVDQVEAIMKIASTHPKVFPRVPDVSGPQVRRGLVRRYGYWIIYDDQTEGAPRSLGLARIPRAQGLAKDLGRIGTSTAKIGRLLL